VQFAYSAEISSRTFVGNVMISKNLDLCNIAGHAARHSVLAAPATQGDVEPCREASRERPSGLGQFRGHHSEYSGDEYGVLASGKLWEDVPMKVKCRRS